MHITEGNGSEIKQSHLEIFVSILPTKKELNLYAERLAEYGIDEIN